MINKEKYNWQTPLRARDKGNHYLNHGGISQRQIIYEEAVIESEARTTAVQLQSEA